MEFTGYTVITDTRVFIKDGYLVERNTGFQSGEGDKRWHFEEEKKYKVNKDGLFEEAKE